MLLTHFQFPIRYEIKIEILTNFKQSYSTHIFYHIHEWRCHHFLFKTFPLDQLLVQWFIKSMLPSITKYVVKGIFVTEEKIISRDQYIDLMYTQSGILYDKISNVMQPSNIVPQPFD